MVPKRFELPHMTSRRTLGVSSLEVVGPKLVVGHAVPHDVVRDLENLVTDRDDGFLVTAFL